MRTFLLVSVVAVIGGGTGCGASSAKQDASSSPTDGGPASNFSFFITSTGNPRGGDFTRNAIDSNGLAGADEFCRTKAVAAVPASANRVWRAYLSTDAVSARDRIGAGPWFNYNGVLIANTVAGLHEPLLNMITKATGLDETGAPVPGRGDPSNQHDILTGSTDQGRTSGSHCSNWTSSSNAGDSARVGHFDRMGNGAAPMSWNSAHLSQGCSAASFPATGGRGSIYCFAAD
jgi:hypothetical protein